MWVFNVADAFVTVGTIALMLYLVREIVLETIAERKARHGGENGVERESNEDA
jgi:lipoprotein signal peptidase